MPTILIADDHPMMASGLASLLAAQPSIAKFDINIVHDVTSLMTALKQLDVSSLILDLDIPGAQGTSALAQITKLYPLLPVVVLSANTSTSIADQCANLGAWHYVNKSADPTKIVDTISLAINHERSLYPCHDNAHDGSWAAKVAQLTPKQHQIYIGVIEGLLNKQIAYNLNISETTVKSHMTAIFDKLKVRDRKPLMVAAQQG